MRQCLQVAFGVCLGLLIMLSPGGAGVAAAPETPSPEIKRSGPAAGPTEKVTVVYLGKAYEEPPPLSLLEKIITDEGVAGSRLGIEANNTTGRFLGQHFVLDEAIVPSDGDVVAKAKDILAKGDALIVADLKSEDLLAVADLPEARNSVILNIRSSRDALREQDCRKNVFHTVPSYFMYADALAQYLIWKRWNRWFLIKGTTPDDQSYAEAVKRSAKRFGGKIVEERTYQFEAGNRRTDSGHQQIQTQMPELTQGAEQHDVVWVADVGEEACLAFRHDLGDTADARGDHRDAT